MFKKLFKPKWQSAKSQVRIQAINNLNIEDGDDLHVLDLLAKGDVDAEVRAVAYQRTPDSGKLLSYIQQEKNSAAQQSAIDRLLMLLNSGEVVLGSQLEAIVKELDTNALASLIEKTKNVELGLLALDGIKEEAILQLYATTLSVSRLRQVAAERLETESVLEAVLKESKGKDKSVYRIIKTKLNTIYDAHKQVENRDQQLDDLCKSAETLARKPIDPLYVATLEHMQKQWARVQSYANADIQQRFQRASDLCRQAVAASTAEEDEQREVSQKLREATEERLAACDQLEEAIKQVSEKDAVTAEYIPALTALLSTQQVRWDEAAETSSPASDERKRFNSALSVLEKVLAAILALKEHGPELENIVHKILELVAEPSAEINRLKKSFDRLMAAIQWPDIIAKPAILVLSEEAIAHFDSVKGDLAAKEKEAAEKFIGVLDKLSVEVEKGYLKSSNKLLRDANRFLKLLPMRKATEYQKQIRELTVKVNELRDWQGYVSAPKKEQLCEAMEALVGVDMDPQALANRIKRMQSEWKMLGGSPDSQAIWERFREAADKAYEPCRDYFDNLSGIRAGHLASRQQLVEQLKNYLTSLDWDAADWRAVNEVYEVAKQEWRRYSPVDRKDGKTVQDQFNGLLQQLRDNLDQEFTSNESKRKKLIETAEALVELEDLPDAIQQAKRLQQQWKSVGMVSRREDSKLWRKFRAVCDQIFARREQEKQAASEARDTNYTDALYLCEQLEQLAESDLMDLDACLADYAKLKSKFDAMGSLPKEKHADVKQRFDVACDACEKIFAGAEKLKQQDQVIELWRKVAVCDELESKLVTSVQANLFEADDVEWGSELEVPKGAEGIEQRYQQLVALAQSGEVLSDAILQENSDKLQELTVLLEIETGIETPADEQEYRMQLQVSRLSGGLSQRENHQVGQKQRAMQYQNDWCAVGLAKPEARAKYTKRFKVALESFG